MWQQLGVGKTEALLTVVTAIGVYLTMLALSRLFGQRQFASTSGYDLAFVFALGSIAGRAILVRVSMAAAVIGLLTMFLMHAGTTWGVHRVGPLRRLVQNRPVLVFAHGRPVEAGVRRGHTSREEIYEAMRSEGVGSVETVQAVILERDGRFSVLRADTPVDEHVLRDVVGAGRLLPRH